MVYKLFDRNDETKWKNLSFTAFGHAANFVENHMLKHEREFVDIIEYELTVNKVFTFTKGEWREVRERGFAPKDTV